jgi:hypothetical protein
MNEAALQSIVRRDFAYIGPIWRNNVGACEDATGRLIRYGLGNDSAQLNKVIKSSDLIGITPVKAFVENVGWCNLGVFTAIECKATGWSFKPGDERAIAQSRFHDIVRQAGGLAGFASDPSHIQNIIKLR